MQIATEAFVRGESIPHKYTCEGENVSPPLTFKNWPKETKSLALIVDDPDALAGTFDHGIAWNIPPKGSLAEGESLPYQGINGFGKLNYQGPCPPHGKPHRYYFKIFALDTLLELPAGSQRRDLEMAMQSRILDQTSLMGTFQR